MKTAFFFPGQGSQSLQMMAGFAVWRVYQARGGKTPSVLAGHSLGEYTALTVANSLNFADAVKLVRQRATLMQTAVPQGKGAMAAVLGLEDNVVVALCEEAGQGEVVEAVNFNSVGQVVIAGDITQSAECAPGKVLADLVKRTDKNLPCAALTDIAAVESLIASQV